MGERGRKDPFDAALGEAILGYLDALPPEDLVRAFLAMRGPSGVREEAFLDAWAGSAAEREELLSVAKKLQDAGQLRRVRVHSPAIAGGEGGEPARILWFRGGRSEIGRSATEQSIHMECPGAWPAVAPVGRTTTDQVGEEPTGCRP